MNYVYKNVIFSRFIIGYVDTIMPVIKAGKNQEYLFKLIISNGNRKIPILIWGDTLIKKYIKDISSATVSFFSAYF